MTVTAMNHFTVLSDDLEATREFYVDFLGGLKVGWRPPFQFPGWWLYADDDTPILHVIHRDPLPKERAGVLDHMAFSAKDLPGTIATLKREADCEIARILRCCEARWEPKRPRLVPPRSGAGSGVRG